MQVSSGLHFWKKKPWIYIPATLCTYSICKLLCSPCSYSNLLIISHLMIMALCDHFIVAGAGRLLQFRLVTSVGRKLSSYLLHSNHWGAMQRYLTFRCWLQKQYKQHMHSKFQSEHTQGGSGLSAAFCPVVVYNMYSLKSYGSMSAHWLRGWSLEKKKSVAGTYIHQYTIICVSAIQYWYKQVIGIYMCM